MSNPINNVHVIEINAWMTVNDILLLDADEDADRPEGCFLDELVVKAKKAKNKTTRIPLDRFSWYGEGSGHSWGGEFFLKVASRVQGTVKAVAAFDCGDLESVWIQDGEVIPSKAVLTVEAEDDDV